MKADEREIRRKRRVLDHAVASGNVAKTCRYFGIPQSLIYRWRNAYQEHGEDGLLCRKPIVKSHPNQTPDEIVEKILFLRRKYHLGPVRIMCTIRLHSNTDAVFAPCSLSADSLQTRCHSTVIAG